MPMFIRRNSAAAAVVAIAVFVTAYGVASAEPGGGGGVATAPAQASKAKPLPKNSVGTKQLKANAVNGSKVANHSLTGTDIDSSTLGPVPNAQSADTLDGRHASDFLGANASAFNAERLGGLSPGSFLLLGAGAGGALSGSYPSPTLNVSGGPCANGRALTNVSPTAALTCGPGVYFDQTNNLATVPNPWPNLAAGAGANAALGDEALVADTEGFANSAFGAFALRANTTGHGNSAFGQGAMKMNVTGYQNSAFGGEALGSNTSGHDNSAFGPTMGSNTTGSGNTAVGVSALEQNTTGDNNVAIGQHAIWQNTTGSENVAIGSGAGAPLVSGSHNVYLGSDNIGAAGESNTIRIGTPGTQSAAYLAGVAGTNLGAQPQVVVNGEGRLGVETSSRRFKSDIRPIAEALNRLMDLRPVSFRYRRADVHGPDRVQFGLLAEQVAHVYPNLVARDGAGRPYTVLYQELPSLLLGQVQRQQRAIHALSAENDRQQAQIEWLMRKIRRR